MKYEPTIEVVDGVIKKTWLESDEPTVAEYASFAKQQAFLRGEFETALEGIKHAVELLNKDIIKNKTFVELRNNIIKQAESLSQTLERQKQLVEMIEKDAQIIKDTTGINIFEYVEEVKEEVATEEHEQVDGE